MMRSTVSMVALLGLAACASLDEFKTETSDKLRPDVKLLANSCATALVADRLDEGALIAKGLEKNFTDGGTQRFDNGLPKKEKGGIVGTGLFLEYQPEKNKCEFSVGPDGFPNTIADLAKAELKESGFVSDDKNGTYTKDGKMMKMSSSRSGDYISYYTTTVSLTLK